MMLFLHGHLFWYSLIVCSEFYWVTERTLTVNKKPVMHTIDFHMDILPTPKANFTRQF